MTHVIHQVLSLVIVLRFCPEFWKEITVSEPILIGASHPQCDCVCVATCEIWLLFCCFGTARKGMVASPE